jgi:hypothetical protein
MISVATKTIGITDRRRWALRKTEDEMAKGLRVLVGAAVLVAVAGCTTKQTAEPSVSVAADVQEDEDRVERSQSVAITAVVEDIDLKKRLVTLRGPEGKTTTITVDESVQNLPQVRKGDQVRVEYYESIAFQLAKPGEAKVGDAAVAEGLERSKPGEKPGGIGARAITIVTRVEAIDKANGTVTLRGPEGRVETIKAQNPANLDKIKVGDTIEITYAQAVAISVEKP